MQDITLLTSLTEMKIVRQYSGLLIKKQYFCSQQPVKERQHVQNAILCSAGISQQTPCES